MLAKALDVTPPSVEEAYENLLKNYVPPYGIRISSQKSLRNMHFISQLWILTPDSFYSQGNLLQRFLREFDKCKTDEDWKNQALHAAFITKNRDAVIAIMKSKLDAAAEQHAVDSPYYQHVANAFDNFYWKDGIQLLMLLITCTPENCCKDYGRLEIIEKILFVNKLDFALPETFVSLAPCPEMKKVLQKWILNTESIELQDERKIRIANDC